jgi:hypothetical protein
MGIHRAKVSDRSPRNALAIPRLNALIALPLAAAALVAAAGCGGSGKPAYCADRNTLQNSITSLPSQVSSGGVSGLKSQVQTIQTDATNLVNSAKSDFPSQTSAISSSVNALKTTVDALPSSPSTTQLATVAANATSVVTSVKSFSDATSSKCG